MAQQQQQQRQRSATTLTSTFFLLLAITAATLFYSTSRRYRRRGGEVGNGIGDDDVIIRAFTLVVDGTDEEIELLKDGDVYNLLKAGQRSSSLALRVEVDKSYSEQIDSVRFDVEADEDNLVHIVDNHEPYILGGDDMSLLCSTVGLHAVHVTLLDLDGAAQTTQTITFNIMDTTNLERRRSPEPVHIRTADWEDEHNSTIQERSRRAQYDGETEQAGLEEDKLKLNLNTFSLRNVITNKRIRWPVDDGAVIGIKPEEWDVLTLRSDVNNLDGQSVRWFFNGYAKLDQHPPFQLNFHRPVEEFAAGGTFTVSARMAELPGFRGEVGRVFTRTFTLVDFVDTPAPTPAPTVLKLNLFTLTLRSTLSGVIKSPIQNGDLIYVPFADSDFLTIQAQHRGLEGRSVRWDFDGVTAYSDDPQRPFQLNNENVVPELDGIVGVEGEHTVTATMSELPGFQGLVGEPITRTFTIVVFTEAPSVAPSDEPSGMPSSSVMPSVSPSEFPSSIPSAIPSELPSELPSLLPSELPSLMPSDKPSEQPSGMPSSIPSDLPSEIPSNMPSRIASNIPSLFPTGSTPGPTDLPTLIPSSFPTLPPTLEPTSGPTTDPTAVPTSKPTFGPSAFPTAIPTLYPTFVQLAISSLGLINIETGETLYSPIEYGDEIFLPVDAFGKLSVVADTGGSGGESVRFSLDGIQRYQTDNTAPYLLRDNMSVPELDAEGLHTIAVTLSELDNFQGFRGDTLHVSFFIYPAPL